MLFGFSLTILLYVMLQLTLYDVVVLCICRSIYIFRNGFVMKTIQKSLSHTRDDIRLKVNAAELHCVRRRNT